MNKRAYFCIFFLLVSILGTIVVIVNFCLAFSQLENGENIMTISNILTKAISCLGTLSVMNCIYAVYIWSVNGISFTREEVTVQKLTKALSVANSLNVFPFGLVLAIVLHKKTHPIS
jgi:hypothetical protein